MSFSRMSDEAKPRGYARPAQRMFLREPGWRIGVKASSERAFCHAIAPGDPHYHRLAEGEIFVSRGDEKFCLPCAERMGLLEHEPRLLAEAPPSLEILPEIFDDQPGFDLASESE